MARSRDAKHDLTMGVERGGWLVASCSCGKWSDMEKAEDGDELFGYWLAHMVKAGKLKPEQVGKLAPGARAQVISEQASESIHAVHTGD